MNKFIIKTALISIAGVALAALMVFALWILISPQTMASSCEKTGNYSFAVTCADLRYKYTKDVSDLARCAEDAILSGKDKYIVNYCEKLVADKDSFENLCKDKDAALSERGYGKYRSSYKTFICGNLAAAQYRTDGLDKAISTAEYGGAQSFTKLVIEIAEKEDGDAAKKVLTAFEGLEQTDDIKNLTVILEKYA